jgi:hypothetical protein
VAAGALKASVWTRCEFNLFCQIHVDFGEKLKAAHFVVTDFSLFSVTPDI